MIKSGKPWGWNCSVPVFGCTKSLKYNKKVTFTLNKQSYCMKEMKIVREYVYRKCNRKVILTCSWCFGMEKLKHVSTFRQSGPHAPTVATIEEGFIQKPRQTVVVYFWGKMAAPLRLCYRQIDKSGPGQ